MFYGERCASTFALGGKSRKANGRLFLAKTPAAAESEAALGVGFDHPQNGYT